MTISIPGASKLALAGLLSKKQRDDDKTKAAPKAMQPYELARRFSKTASQEVVKPAKLNATEKEDRERLSSLRGALYSKN